MLSAVCLACFCVPVGAAEPPELAQVQKTGSGVRYGIWPPRPEGTSPEAILVVLGSSIEETLNNAYFRQSGNFLARKGYRCVSIDLPCHGQERRPGEPEGLAGWRFRVERGEDVMEELTSRLRQVVDHLIAKGVADPKRLAACGTSRGGYAALHLAASDSRIQCVAAFAPVTDLRALREFQGLETNELVRSLDLSRRAESLAGRPVFLVIGDRDDRVGTDKTIELARQVTRASLRLQRPALVDLHVLSEPKGHTTPRGSAELAADWIDRNLQPSSESPTKSPHNPFE